ncbi:MAG: hypothetical protein FJ295_08445 [Planctomycetes bacterium]|nr:hypothetical protein [Planctomycetota bacterium]
MPQRSGFEPERRTEFCDGRLVGGRLSRLPTLLALLLAAVAIGRTSTVAGQAFTPQSPLVLRGHFSDVLMARFTRKGLEVVTGSADETLRLWDARTGVERRQYLGHTGPVYCLALSEDGRTLVSGAQDNTVRVWDIPQAVPTLRLGAHDGVAGVLVFSPDGRFLVTGGVDKAVRLWDGNRLQMQLAAMGDKPAPLDRSTASNRAGHLAEVRAVAYRADGTQFATADTQGQILLWSPFLDTPVGSLGQHAGGIDALLFHPNNQNLLSAGVDGTLRIWQLPPVGAREIVVGAPIRDQLLVPGQLMSVVATEDKSLRLVDGNTGQIAREFPKQEQATSALAIAPNGGVIAVADEVGRVRMLNFADGADRGTLAGHTGPIRDLTILADNQKLLTAGQDGTYRTWVLPTPVVPVNGHSMPVRAAVSAASGQWFATAGDDKTVRIWNPQGQPVRNMGQHQQGITALAIRPDDQQLCSGDADGVVWFWNGADGAVQGSVFAHTGAVTAMDYDRAQPCFWTAGADGTIKRWQLPLVPPRLSSGHSQPIRAIAVSSDGRWSVTGSQDQTVRVWDQTTGQQVRALPETNLLGPVTAVAISPDNTLVAAAGETGPIMVWNLADGVIRMRRMALPGAIHDLAFLPDGKRIATISQDQAVRIWSLIEPVKELANDAAPYLVAASSLDGKRMAIAGTAAGKPVVWIRDRDSGQTLATLGGHEAAVSAIAFNRAGTRVITGSADKTARVWNLEAGGAELKKLEGHTAAVLAVGLSDDASVAWTSASENPIRQWTVADGKETRQLAGHTGIVRSFVVRGALGFSAADDGTVRVWDLTSGAATRAMAHGAAVRTLDASPDGTRLLSAGADRVVKLWNVADGANPWSVPAAASDLTAASFSGDIQKFVVAAGDGIRVYQVLDGRLLEKIDEAPTTLQGAVWNANGRSIVVCRGDGRSALHSLAVDQAVAAPDPDTVALAVSADGKWLAASGSGKLIRLWPIADGRIGQTAPVRSLTAGTAKITDIGFSPDGQFFASASEDKTVSVWESATMLGAGGDVAPKWKLLHTALPRGLAISNSEPRLATCGDDGFVTTWDLRTGKAAERMTQAQPQRCLAWAGGRSIVSGGADAGLRTWTPALSFVGEVSTDATPDPILQLHATAGEAAVVGITQRNPAISRWKADGTRLAPLASPAGPIKQLAVQRDGSRLLAAAADGNTVVWSLADGAMRGPFAFGPQISSAVFGRDGTEVWVCDAQQRVRAFGLEPFRVNEEIPFASMVSRGIVTGAEGRQVVAFGAAPQGLLANRALLRVGESGAPSATAVAATADGARAFIGTVQGRIAQVRLADGQLERSLDGHTDQIHELLVTGNGQTLISCSRDKSVRVWNLADGKQSRAMVRPSVPLSISLSADGQKLAIAGDDGRVDAWDFLADQPLQSFVGHAAGPLSARWHSDNLTLISASADKSIRFGKLAALSTIRMSDKELLDVIAYNGGTQLATLTADGQATLVNLLADGQIVRKVTIRYTLGEGLNDARALAMRPDSQRVAVGYGDGQLRIWNVGNGELLQTMKTDAPVQALAWTADGTRLAAATAVGPSTGDAAAPASPATAAAPAGPPVSALYFFGPPLPPQNPQPGNELIPHQRTEYDHPFTRIGFDKDGRNLWSVHPNGQVNSWAYAALSFVRRFDHGGPVYAVAVSRDGNTIVSGSTDQTLRIFDVRTGQQRAQLTGHTAAVHAIAFTPDESMVVSAAGDRTIRLWDVTGGRQLKQLATFDETMYAVAVHPNGQSVAVGGADRKIHLLNILSGAEERVLEGHNDFVHCVSFNATGTRLLSYGYAGNLKVWNLADGKPLFAERVGRVGNTAYYQSDDARVVLANGDGMARVVELPGTAR